MNDMLPDETTTSDVQAPPHSRQAEEAATALGRMLDGDQRRPGPLAADGDALQEA